MKTPKKWLCFGSQISKNGFCIFEKKNHTILPCTIFGTPKITKMSSCGFHFHSCGFHFGSCGFHLARLIFMWFVYVVFISGVCVCQNESHGIVIRFTKTTVE